jgi:phosphoglucosamine mutase
MLMEVMLEKKEKLSKLRKELKVYPQLLKNVRVADKPAARQDADVVAAVERVEKALGDEGRILLRESGTEPVIRVMVEADTEELCRQYVEEVVAVLRQKGHILS